MEAILPEVSRATLASVLGYTSIGFWLFAQAPQVVKNARLRSCEGLALPFLCNWLFGDITNLVGCILTDQLPFQTYLAAYFCVIDFTLVGQFFYYRPSHPPAIYRNTPVIYTSSPHQSLSVHTAPISHNQHHNHHNLSLSQSHVYANSQTRAVVPHTRTRSSSSAPTHYVPPLSASTSSTVRPPLARGHTSADTATTSAQSSIYRGREGALNGNTHLAGRDGSYQAIYEAALDVARAAERAEIHRQHSQSRSRTRRSRVPSGRPSVNSVMPDVEEDLLPALGNRSAMFDSFHSDMSALTDGSGTSSVAGPSGGEGQQNLTPSSSPLLSRGRSLQRTPTYYTPPQEGEEGEDVISGLPGEGGRGMVQMRETGSRSKSRSVSMARGGNRGSGSGSARRAAGVAFMSLGMLAGWGGTGRAAKLRSGPHAAGGIVLSGPKSISPSSYSTKAFELSHPLTLLPSTHQYPNQRYPVTSEPDITYIPTERSTNTDHPQPQPPIDEPPDYKRIIGRVSAWACTTLYLTSRLPQIWKNFERKSVEGLSILLFLFAFCGNTAYVASIVYNPAASPDSPDAIQYLLEALPYLLGSGGTLLFDLTIIFQSLLYGSAPPVPQATIERSSFRRPLFRRKLRLAEEGRAPTSSMNGTGTFGERQPLLSSSMTMTTSQSGIRRQQQQPHQQPQAQRETKEIREPRARSVSADVQLGRDGGVWREPGSTIAGLRRVEIDVPDDEPDGEVIEVRG